MMKYYLPLALYVAVFIAEPRLRWPFVYLLGAYLVLLLAFALWDKYVGMPRLRKTGIYPEPGKGTQEDVLRLKKMGQTILAIRLYREITKAGLKEAKRAVSELPG